MSCGFCKKLRWHSYIQFNIQALYCHVHRSCTEAVVGNEILKSQAPSNNAQKYAKGKSHK